VPLSHYAARARWDAGADGEDALFRCLLLDPTVRRITVSIGGLRSHLPFNLAKGWRMLFVGEEWLVWIITSCAYPREHLASSVIRRMHNLTDQILALPATLTSGSTTLLCRTLGFHCQVRLASADNFFVNKRRGERAFLHISIPLNESTMVVACSRSRVFLALTFAYVVM